MSNERRLPIYILLDTSGSMQGDPIQAVNQGLLLLVNDLLVDPTALELAYLSVITFNNSAQQIVPLTEINNFSPPTLSAGGATCLGEALKLLSECINTEVRKPTANIKADYKPLVFLMTDGKPTDSWERYAQELRERKPAQIVACAAGAGADALMLKNITENVVKISSLSAGDLEAYFKWVSASIVMTSNVISNGNDQYSDSDLPTSTEAVVIV